MNGSSAGLEILLAVLDRLDIRYYVTGSLASSVHGIARATMDVDLVAAVAAGHVAPLVAALDREFYADPEMIADALRRGRSFNLIHYASTCKFDIFPAGRDEYAGQQFARRRRAEMQIDNQTISFWCSSPEDAILSKLNWYRSGGEVSDQQWNDVLGMIAVQRAQLDLIYLRRWAGYLQVLDLLEQSLA